MDVECGPSCVAAAALIEKLETQRGNAASSAEVDTINKFASKAQRNLWSIIKLVKRQNSEKKMRDALVECPPVAARGDGVSDLTCIWLDPKALSVSATHPNARALGSVNPDEIRFLIRSFLSTRENPAQLHPGDIFHIMDGGCHGNRSKLLAAFCDEACEVIDRRDKTIYVNLDEDCKLIEIRTPSRSQELGPNS